MKHLFIAGICLGVLWGTSAIADLSNPQGGETWSQCFSLTDIATCKETDNTFDKLEINMTGNKELGPLGLYDQNPAGSLSLSKNGPSHVVGLGTDVGTLEFTLQFLGPQPDPTDKKKATEFNFSVYDWDGSKYVKSGHGEAYYKEGEWAINLDNQSVSLGPCMPLPGAVLLGLLGLGAAGAKLRKLA
jgi:hypothetical protein